MMRVVFGFVFLSCCVPTNNATVDMLTDFRDHTVVYLYCTPSSIRRIRITEIATAGCAVLQIRVEHLRSQCQMLQARQRDGKKLLLFFSYF